MLKFLRALSGHYSMRAQRPQGGFWVVSCKGRVLNFRGAPHFGDIITALPKRSQGLQGRINKPICAILATTTGQGYYLAAEDGGVFTFGDAVFYGSLGKHGRREPITNITARPEGQGYILWSGEIPVTVFKAEDMAVNPR